MCFQKNMFERPGVFIANAAGGIPSNATLAEMDYCSTRNVVPKNISGCDEQLVPDTVVMMKTLFGAQLSRRQVHSIRPGKYLMAFGPSRHRA